MKLYRNPVLGAITGDMIGVPYEWYCKKGLQIPEDFELWTKDSHFSDDTVMTIAVAEWLLYPPYNTYNLVSIMQKWGRKYRRAGYGHLFGQWIDSDNPQPYGSFGNGSAMRVSPVGCAFKTLETTLEIAEESAAISHNHPEGIKGAKCIADLIFRTLQYNDLETKEEPYKEGFLLVPSIDYKYKVDRTPQQIIDSGYKFDSTCQGSVPEAICCFLYSNSYEETIRNAIMLRGDADTQAAIAGSIAAAYWGVPQDIHNECVERLPDDMYDVLEKFSEKFDLEL
jgi:ADP-ribosylglycohydrolase